MTTNPDRARVWRPLPSASQPLVIGLLALALALVLAFDSSGDYDQQHWAPGNNAGPAMAALLDGDLERFFALQPMMGLASILLRLPFVAVAEAFTGDPLILYRAGALACLLPAIALGVYLSRAMKRRGSSSLAGLTAAVLCVVNPLTMDALISGHPEEVPAAVLAIVGILAASSTRSPGGGVMLGLAAGTKQWALAALPIGLALARLSATRMALAAAVAATLMLAPGFLANRDAFSAANRTVSSSRQVNYVSAWWPLAERRTELVGAGAPTTVVERRILPAGMSRGTAMGVVMLVACLLALLVWRRPDRETALAVLSLALLVRCALDPGNLLYYQLGALLALLTWESLTRRGLPIISLLATATWWGLFTRGTTLGEAEANLLYLGSFLLLSGYLLAQALPRRAVAPREIVLSDPSAIGLRID